MEDCSISIFYKIKFSLIKQMKWKSLILSMEPPNSLQTVYLDSPWYILALGASPVLLSRTPFKLGIWILLSILALGASLGAFVSHPQARCSPWTPDPPVSISCLPPCPM